MVVPSGSCRCKRKLSVAVNPIGAGYWRGIRVPRTARLAQSHSRGSLDRASLNSIWRRVSIQVSVASSKAPRSSVRHTCQERCSVTACHTAHDHAVPMPQSAGNDANKSSGLFMETTSRRAPCSVTPFLASGVWPKAETCKATYP